MAHKHAKAEPYGSTTVTENTTLTLSTLAQFGVVSVAGPVMTRGGRLISTTTAIAWLDRDALDGPILIGICGRELLDAELVTYLTTQGPTFPGDNTPRESASRGRFVRKLALLATPDSAEHYGILLKNEPLRGLPWSQQTQGWRWWAFNQGATLVSGSTVQFTSDHFVSWAKEGS